MNDTSIRPGYQTDHSIPTIELNFHESQRGPGYWKFNVSLLDDPDYVSQLDSLLDIQLGQEAKDVKTKWELAKLTIRTFTLDYSAKKQNAKRNELDKKN